MSLYPLATGDVKSLTVLRADALRRARKGARPSLPRPLSVVCTSCRRGQTHTQLYSVPVVRSIVPQTPRTMLCQFRVLFLPPGHRTKNSLPVGKLSYYRFADVLRNSSQVIHLSAYLYMQKRACARGCAIAGAKTRPFFNGGV